MSEHKRDRTALIAVIAGVVALMLGLCLGAALGGFGGYLIGRQAVRPALQPMPEPEGDPYPPSRQPPGLRIPDVTGLSGAWVREVIDGSPAERAGLQTGDLITAVGDTPLDADHPLADVIGAHKPGDRVVLTVWRFGDMLTVDVTLAPASDAGHAYLGVRYADFSMDNHPPNPNN